MAKYKERIEELFAKGLTCEVIAERLGCSYHTVYHYKPRHPKKYNDEGLRWCYKCKQYKPVDEFCEDSYSSDGLQSKCKACNKEYAMNRRKALKDKEYYKGLDRNQEYVTIDIISNKWRGTNENI